MKNAEKGKKTRKNLQIVIENATIKIVDKGKYILEGEE